MSSALSADFQFDFDVQYQGFNPFTDFEPIQEAQPVLELEPVPEINLDDWSPGFCMPLPNGEFANATQNTRGTFLDGSSAFEYTTDEYWLPATNQRNLSASMWVPCSPPPLQAQQEPSRWVLLGPQANLDPRSAHQYPDPEQLMVQQQGPHASSPYLASSAGRMHNFSQITPPGRQTPSIFAPLFTHRNVPILVTPPPRRYRPVPRFTDTDAPNAEDLALSPTRTQPNEKRKRCEPFTLTNPEDKNDSGSELSCTPPTPSVFSGRRPPKKLGRPSHRPQTAERRKHNKRRMEYYYKRKNDPAYVEKLNQWTRQSYRRWKHQRYGNTTMEPKGEELSKGDEGALGEESERYVLGSSGHQLQEGCQLRRSGRPRKPRFVGLEF